MATILPWLVCICSYFFLHNIVPNAHGFNPAGLPATTSTTKRVVRISSIVDKSVPRGTLPSTINNHQFSERNVVSSVSQLGLAFHPTTYAYRLRGLRLGKEREYRKRSGQEMHFPLHKNSRNLAQM